MNTDPSSMATAGSKPKKRPRALVITDVPTVYPYDSSSHSSLSSPSFVYLASPIDSPQAVMRFFENSPASSPMNGSHGHSRNINVNATPRMLEAVPVYVAWPVNGPAEEESKRHNLAAYGSSPKSGTSDLSERIYTPVACMPCFRSKIKCDMGRPCTNCLKRDLTSSECIDRIHKQRGRPKKKPNTSCSK